MGLHPCPPSPLSLLFTDGLFLVTPRGYLVLFQLLKEADSPFSVSIPDSPKGAFDVTCLG